MRVRRPVGKISRASLDPPEIALRRNFFAVIFFYDSFNLYMEKLKRKSQMWFLDKFFVNVELMQFA